MKPERGSEAWLLARSEVRFEEQREEVGSHWLWRNACDERWSRWTPMARNGKGSVVSVHKIIWEALGREVPEGYRPVSTCGIDICVKPSHIGLVPKAQRAR